MMNSIIKQILGETSFVEVENEITFYAKGDESFFFLLDLPLESFKQIKTKQHLKTSEEYSRFIKKFEYLIDSRADPAIEKNSSLFVLVKCESITELEELRQQIFLFEEDQYFLKKYVILYTDESIQDFPEEMTVETLREKLNDDDEFKLFAVQGYSDDIAEYLVVLQLFIKLPFLSLGDGNADFTSLEEKLSTELGDDLRLYERLLEKAEEINGFDFTDPSQKESIEQLINSLENDQD